MATLVNYLINVDSRTDRLMNVTKRFDEIDETFIRISAITGDSLIGKVYLFTKPNTEANWRSILKTLDDFIESELDFALICEDDVIFEPGFGSFIRKFKSITDINFDVLQVGYLVFDGKNDDRGSNTFKRLKRNLLDMFMLKIARHALFLKFVNEYEFNTKLKARYQLKESLKLSDSLEPQFEPGTHCFIVSREFALKIQKFNLPMLMSADLVFMTLSKMPDLRIFRLGKSLANQDDTSPSIGGHATVEFDFTHLIF